MTKPLIQQLAERVGWSVDHLTASNSLKLLVELCAYLDEQAADKPEPPTALTEPRCACGHVQSQHKNTRGYCYQLCPDGSRCQCSSFHALTALTELRTIPGATGANAETRVTCAADIWGDGAFFCSLPSGHEGRHEVYAPRAEWEARRNRIVGEVARYRLALQAANHDLWTTRFQLEEARAKLAELEQSRVEYLALSRAELAKVTAERDEARAELAVVRVKLYDAVSAHNENLTRSFDSDMVLRDKLAKVTAERDELRSTLANINADRAYTRAVVEAARRYSDIAGEPIHHAPRLHALREALYALDKRQARGSGGEVMAHELETAEEFWFTTMSHDLSPEDALWLIEARDAAVALRVLDEWDELSGKLMASGKSEAAAMALACDILRKRAKYEVK